jgi:hypothetical protein
MSTSETPSQVQELLEAPRAFIKQSQLLVTRCTKPDRKGTHSKSNFRKLELFACLYQSPFSMINVVTLCCTSGS